MDPNEALNRVRHGIEKYKEAVDAGDEYTAQEYTEYIVEHFEALDGWLKNGGFFPTDWNPKRETAR